MGWTGFKKMGPVQVSSKFENGWNHDLVAPQDEPNPHSNHVHFKYRNKPDDGTAQLVNCSLKVEGQHAHSRSVMIETINRAAGLSIRY